MLEKIKGAWKSSVIWFNGVMAVILPNLPMAQESFPQLREYLPAHVYGWAISVLIVVNIALRFKTTKPLEDK